MKYMVFQWSSGFLDLKYFIINHKYGLNMKKKLIQDSKNKSEKNTLGNKKVI